MLVSGTRSECRGFCLEGDDLLLFLVWSRDIVYRVDLISMGADIIAENGGKGHCCFKIFPYSLTCELGIMPSRCVLRSCHK